MYVVTCCNPIQYSTSATDATAKKIILRWRNISTLLTLLATLEKLSFFFRSAQALLFTVAHSVHTSETTLNTVVSWIQGFYKSACLGHAVSC